MGPVTRKMESQRLKQTTLTSLDGSLVIIEDNDVCTPQNNQTVRITGTPGRAHRLDNVQKTLFPKQNAEAKSIVKDVIDDIIRRAVDSGRDQEATTSVTDDRVVLDILRDATASHPQPPLATDNDSLLEFYKQRVVDLTRQVLETGERAEKLQAHAEALESGMQLLNQDISDKLREIKRLQSELDKSRLELSKATGIRRHLDAKGTGSKSSKETTPVTVDTSIIDAMKAEFATNRAEMAALKEQLNRLTESNEPFQLVNRKQRRGPAQSPSSQAPQNPPLYSDVASGRAPKPTTISFGTSLVRDTHRALRNYGVNAQEHCFPGYHLRQLRKEIVPILQRNPQVDTVIITAGGNDCERRGSTLPQIKAEYDALVDTIKIQQGWNCKVIINSVPQRRRISTETRLKIAGLNLQHRYYADPDDNIFYVDSAPKYGSHFVDRVHFNHHGLQHWARKVSEAISNFPSDTSQARM